MNTNLRKALTSTFSALLFAGAAACSADVDPNDDGATETAEQSAALISHGGLGVDGDACSITGGPNKDKTGTRSGNFCCTGAGGTGHCQDCTTPSDWCSSTVKARRPISTVRTGAAVRAR